jgi:hypothetical protein
MNRKWGVVAEFDSAAAIYAGAKKVIDQGYTKVDAHTPFPVHGIENVLKQGASHVGWIAAFMGLCGIAGAQLMMWWMNKVDYEIWVSGKPPYAWESTIPITFECMVLLASFGALFAMLGINKLPRLHNPLFRHSTFHRASDDRFFLSIDSTDPKFDQMRTPQVLAEAGGHHVEVIEDE